MEIRTYHIEILIGLTLVVWLLTSLFTDVMDGLIAASVVAIVGTMIIIYMGSQKARSSRSSRPDGLQRPLRDSLQDYERAIRALRERQQTLKDEEDRLNVQGIRMRRAMDAVIPP